MKQIELSQEELKVLIGVINLIFTKGGINTGDAFALTALVIKLDKFIEKTEEPKSELTTN